MRCIALLIACSLLTSVACGPSSPAVATAKAAPTIEYGIAELDTKELSGVQVLPLLKPNIRATTLAVKLPLERAHLKSAKLATDHAGFPSVLIEFAADDANHFSEFTEKHVHEQLVFIVGGKVVSNATIDERLPASAVISGRFSQAEAEGLLTALN